MYPHKTNYLYIWLCEAYETRLDYSFECPVIWMIRSFKSFGSLLQ